MTSSPTHFAHDHGNNVLKIADIIKSNEVLSPTHFAHDHGNNVLKIADVIKSNEVLSPTHFAHDHGNNVLELSTKLGFLVSNMCIIKMSELRSSVTCQSLRNGIEGCDEQIKYYRAMSKKVTLDDKTCKFVLNGLDEMYRLRDDLYDELHKRESLGGELE